MAGKKIVKSKTYGQTPQGGIESVRSKPVTFRENVTAFSPQEQSKPSVMRSPYRWDNRVSVKHCDLTVTLLLTFFFFKYPASTYNARENCSLEGLGTRRSVTVVEVLWKSYMSCSEKTFLGMR